MSAPLYRSYLRALSLANGTTAFVDQSSSDRDCVSWQLRYGPLVDLSRGDKGRGRNMSGAQIMDQFAHLIDPHVPMGTALRTLKLVREAYAETLK